MLLSSPNCPTVVDSFKHCDMLSNDPQFKEIVKSAISKAKHGHTMYTIIETLKSMKRPLKQLNRDKSKDSHIEQQISRAAVENIHKKLQTNLYNAKQTQIKKEKMNHLPILKSSLSLLC